MIGLFIKTCGRCEIRGIGPGCSDGGAFGKVTAGEQNPGGTV